MLAYKCQQNLWLAGPQNHKYHRPQIYDHNKARNITIHNLSLNWETNKLAEGFTNKKEWLECLCGNSSKNEPSDTPIQ